jgi:hypothetical protein
MDSIGFVYGIILKAHKDEGRNKHNRGTRADLKEVVHILTVFSIKSIV